MQIPEIHPISCIDKFKSIRKIGTLESDLIYSVVGFGNRKDKVNNVECWIIQQSNKQFLIPKDTLTTLYENKIVVRL